MRSKRVDHHCGIFAKPMANLDIFSMSLMCMDEKASLAEQKVAGLS